MEILRNWELTIGSDPIFFNLSNFKKCWNLLKLQNSWELFCIHFLALLLLPLHHNCRHLPFISPSLSPSASPSLFPFTFLFSDFISQVTMVEAYHKHPAISNCYLWLHLFWPPSHKDFRTFWKLSMAVGFVLRQTYASEVRPFLSSLGNLRNVRLNIFT